MKLSLFLLFSLIETMFPIVVEKEQKQKRVLFSSVRATKISIALDSSLQQVCLSHPRLTFPGSASGGPRIKPVLGVTYYLRSTPLDVLETRRVHPTLLSGRSR